MLLWLAWVVAFLATAVLTISLNELFTSTGVVDIDSPALVGVIILAFWLIGSFGTPLVAYRKGRRWWLWLILGIFGQLPSFFAVAFAEHPSSPISPEERKVSRAETNWTGGAE